LLTSGIGETGPMFLFLNRTRTRSRVALGISLPRPQPVPTMVWRTGCGLELYAYTLWVRSLRQPPPFWYIRATRPSRGPPILYHSRGHGPSPDSALLKSRRRGNPGQRCRPLRDRLVTLTWVMPQWTNPTPSLSTVSVRYESLLILRPCGCVGL
jgi:hypothetical protein